MKQIFKRVDEIAYSMFIVLLSTLIFMRYSQDAELSKSLIQGGLFQYVLPTIALYFSIKMCISVAQILIQFENKTHKYSAPLSNLVLYGASLYSMRFLFKYPDISSHINMQILLVIPGLLSFGFWVSKVPSLDKTLITTYRIGAHNE